MAVSRLTHLFHRFTRPIASKADEFLTVFVECVCIHVVPITSVLKVGIGSFLSYGTFGQVLVDVIDILVSHILIVSSASIGKELVAHKVLYIYRLITISIIAVVQNGIERNGIVGAVVPGLVLHRLGFETAYLIAWPV